MACGVGRMWAAIGTVVSLGACAVDARDGAGVVVRDSAGVRIVENIAPRLPAGWWIVAREPAVEIGAAEDDSTQNLFEVQGALRLSDGRILIANAALPAL